MSGEWSESVTVDEMYGDWDYEAAVDKFEIAAAANPDDPDVLSAIAFVWRRQGKVLLGAVISFGMPRPSRCSTVAWMSWTLVRFSTAL